jgi:transposase-like protein
MEITYTNPNSSATLTVTGTAEELAPLVLQLVNDLPVIPSITTSSTKKTSSKKTHSSSSYYKDMRKQIIADFANGLDRDALADKYPVSRTSINKWIRQANLSTYKTKNNSRKTAVRKPSNNDLQPSNNDLRQRIESISIR